MMKKPLSILFFALAAAAVFSSCKEPDERETEIPVSKVDLNEQNLTLKIGDKVVLAATVTPEEATDKKVLWESSAPAVATVGADGTVTAVATGTAEVTATAGGMKSAACAVKVLGEVENSGKTGPLDWEITTDGTLVISGHGAMPDYNMNPQSGYLDTPWFLLRNTITSIVIEQGVTRIGNYAFGSCQAFLDIEIPETVTSIGDYAFWANQFIEIELPSHLNAIGIGLFWECYNLKSVTFPDGITTIPESTFFHCRSLEEVNYPEHISEIGFAAFEGTRIKSVSFANVSLLGEAAFRGCPELTDATFTGALGQVNIMAFQDCPKLKTVSYPATLRTVYWNTFYGCPALESVTCHAVTPPNVVTGFGWEADAVKPDVVLRVPAGSIEKYRTSNRWGVAFDNIVAIE